MKRLDLTPYRPQSWAGVWIEVRDARTNIASIVHSPMWSQLDRGQRRAVGYLLADLRRLAAVLGDA